MSELDFLLNRKKRTEQKEEKKIQSGEEKREESRVLVATYEEKSRENEEKRKEEKTEEMKREESREENNEVQRENPIVSDEKREESRDDNVESIMKSFLDKDPKIGVWSYPAFLVLQYLYNTKPGFKMSKVAREALEYGLKKMYPELFEKAEKISQLKYK